MEESINRDSQIFNLTVRQIDEIINDNILRHKGYKIFYIIDTLELFEFCFPFGLRPENSPKNNVNVTRLIEDQIALFSIFYGTKRKPIILDEYLTEIQGLRKYISYLLSTGVNIINQIDELIEQVKESERFDFNALKKNIKDDLLKRNINLVLSILMGQFSDGLERFSQVFSEEHLYIRNFIENSTIEDIFNTNRGGTLTPAIFNLLKKEINSNDWLIATNLEASINSAKIDAIAIDRIININKAITEENNRGATESKYLFLYLSSASRSNKIFHSDLVNSNLPIIDGIPYPLLRNRSQIFTEAVFRRNRTIDTIHDLNMLKRLVYNTKHYKVYKDDLAADKINAAMFERTQTQIRNYGERAENFGLLSTASIKDYLDVFRQSENIINDHEFFLFIEKIEKFIDSKEYVEINREKRNVNMYLRGVAQTFNSILSVILKLEDRKIHSFKYYHQGRDKVVAVINQFPVIFINLVDKRYKELIREITKFYLNHYTESVKLIQNVCEEFMKMDEDIYEIIPNHEIVRSLLVMSHPTNFADRIAFNYIEDVLVSNLETLDLDTKCNLIYIMIWTSRRNKDYPAAQKYINQGLSLNKNDPRFYHGRCLNTYAWLMETDQESERPADINIETAIVDAKRAIKLYGQLVDTDLNLNIQYVICGLYNTLAYINIIELQEKEVNIIEANKYFEMLKKFDDKYWKRYPEYLHTEAVIRFEEYKKLKANGFDSADQLVKLSEALNCITQAESIAEDTELEDFRLVVKSEILILQLS